MLKLKNKIFLIIFGLFLFLILIEFSLRLAGGIYILLQERKNSFSSVNKGQLRILCLGESTTAGVVDAYPQQLSNILRTKDAEIEFNVINKGKPGINSTYILAQLENNLDKYRPNIVVVMMGINDRGSYYWDNFSELPEFIADLRIVKLAKVISQALKKRLDQSSFLRVKQGPPKSNKVDSSYLNNLILKGTELREKNNYFASEIIFRKVLYLDSNNSHAYVGLGWIALGRGDMAEAELLFNKAIALDPNQVDAFVGLGWFLRSQGRYDDSESKFSKAIAINSQRDDAYAGLGWLYRDQEKLPQAEEFFKKAIEINPDGVNAYLGLAWLYLDLNKFDEALLILNKALSFDGQQKDLYYLMATTYLLQNNYSEAEKYFKKLIRLDPQDSRSYSYLAFIYQKTARPKKANEALKKAAVLRRIADDSLTKRNYIKMKHILDKRGIQMVCMQYPMISIQPLKDFLKGESGIIFVENESSFKEALKSREVSDYFTDMFAGEFGHCTALGNKLIAQNVADAILRSYADKK